VRVPIPDDLILGLLAYRPQHGYELLAAFEAPAELGRVWTMSRSQVYAVLKRLEALGLIRGRSMRGQDAPDRVEYAVTAAGRRKLEGWLDESEPSASVRSMRVSLSANCTSPSNRRPLGPIIERQAEACLERLRFHGSPARAVSVTEQRSPDFVSRQLRQRSWLACFTCASGLPGR
jgi:DNA-binding PadR family transcriptional regulator